MRDHRSNGDTKINPTAATRTSSVRFAPPPAPGSCGILRRRSTNWAGGFRRRSCRCTPRTPRRGDRIARRRSASCRASSSMGSLPRASARLTTTRSTRCSLTIRRNVGDRTDHPRVDQRRTDPSRVRIDETDELDAQLPAAARTARARERPRRRWCRRSADAGQSPPAATATRRQTASRRRAHRRAPRRTRRRRGQSSGPAPSSRAPPAEVMSRRSPESDRQPATVGRRSCADRRGRSNEAQICRTAPIRLARQRMPASMFSLTESRPKRSTAATSTASTISRCSMTANVAVREVTRPIRIGRTFGSLRRKHVGRGVIVSIAVGPTPLGAVEDHAENPVASDAGDGLLYVCVVRLAGPHHQDGGVDDGNQQ